MDGREQESVDLRGPPGSVLWLQELQVPVYITDARCARRIPSEGCERRPLPATMKTTSGALSELEETSEVYDGDCPTHADEAEAGKASAPVAKPKPAKNKKCRKSKD